ncbi:hypothetical protein MK079_04310, partial [Candidatus Gracilibacteria bacterium]|nr:hypothetical protein [Candidatus Gracilibacteria bacterium]
MITKQELHDIIVNNILISKDKDTSIHGNSTWILDFRSGCMNGTILEKFASFFWDTYESQFPFQVGGIETGAIPLISAILIEGTKRGKNVNGFYVRKQRKETGLGNIIEGSLNDDKIIIVDDLYNGGSSLLQVFHALKTEEKTIYRSFVFVNFGNPSGKEKLLENNIVLDYVFTLSQLGLTDYVAGPKNIYPSILPKSKKIFHLPFNNKFLQAPKSNPIIQEEKMYLTGEGGEYFCISKDTGDVLWAQFITQNSFSKNILSSAVYIQDSIVFGAYDGNLYFLDPHSGSKKYVFENRADWIGSSPCYDPNNHAIYIGLEYGSDNNKGSLISIDIKTGQINWEFLFQDYVHCSPYYSDTHDIVICGGNDGYILGVSGKTGTCMFKFELTAPIKGGFVSNDDQTHVYFGSHDGKIYTIDMKTYQLQEIYTTQNIVYAKGLCHKN